ncbi:hypothetical protein BJ875DRAFT_470078 [Amylocarpus encephaloides]|uniref:Uncharacterized protein n=1 Tax=Amylocarpus encephaloides TaxID=45428 RepID=A0A9P7YDW8_9HELO|nr:hypothetical protein BJ875DRAFT_470078 [Amylocarpus encephaloides]
MRSTGDNSNTLSPTHASSLEPPGERKESVAVSPKTVPTTTTAVPGSNLDQEDTSNIGVKFSEQQAPLETRETTTTADNGRPSHSPIFPSGAGVVSGHVDSPMHGAHSHRGTGQFRTTQGTLNARASRDLDDKSHNSLEAHRMDARSKSIAESMHDGKGAEGGMPDVIKKDLEYTKPGQISAEFAGTGGSTAGLDEGSARKVVDSSKTGDSAHHSATGSSTTHPGEKEKMGLGDKIKAKLHHN